MIATRDVDRIIGCEAIGSDASRIGTVSRIFVDERSSLPTWAIVRTGLFGLGESAVPLDRADWDERALRVAVTRDDACHAPHLPQRDTFSDGDQVRLYTHYGIDPAEPAWAGDVCYSIHFDKPVLADR